MMKKKLFPVIAALAAVLTLFAACYQDIELDDPAPGSLLPVAGAYNMRDVGGYETLYDMARGRALGAFNDAKTAWEAAGSPMGTNLTDGTGLALKNAWNSLQSGYPELGLTAISGAADLGNMAALGGGLAKDGSSKTGVEKRRVKSGLIIRSGDLSRLTERDISYLKGWGVQAVIDFRGIAPASGGRDPEREADKDRPIPSALSGSDTDLHPITGFLSTTFATTQTAGSSSARAVPGSNSTRFPLVDTQGAASNLADAKFGDRFAIEEGVVGSMDTFLGVDNGTLKSTAQMVKGYKDIMGNKAEWKYPSGATYGDQNYMNSGAVQFHNFFMYLLYTDGDETGSFRTSPAKVIFHCSAGKDRTGIAAALFYSALGVPRETIIKDYLLSAQYVAEKYAPVVNVLGEQMEPLVSVKREYIESLFNYIDTEFSATTLYYAADADNANNTSGVDSTAGSPDVAAEAAVKRNVYPNVSYDKSASVIKFLTTPVNAEAKTAAAFGAAVFHGGLGLTMDQIYQLRKLYLE
ncbi:hypothetical protein FACS1894110_10390 [Spirochaetia bacterium]|nr:hypothetical protein FACS1894110_10390 [Spirochaetia bacterium]